MKTKREITGKLDSEILISGWKKKIELKEDMFQTVPKNGLLFSTLKPN